MPNRPPRSLGIIGEEAAKQLLEPHHDALFRVVTRAFERFQDGPIALTSAPSLTYKAMAMHELMVDEARARFATVEGVQLLDEQQQFLLKIGDGLIVRLKKVDSELRTANYPTPRAVAFDAQADIAGLEPLPRITVGYQPDRTWSALSSVVVMLSLRKDPVWSYELTGQSAAVQPLSPLADQVIVKPKKQMSIFELLATPKKP
jgi:hypothetical protein